jgi:hypothetical protein
METRETGPSTILIDASADCIEMGKETLALPWERKPVVQTDRVGPSSS